MFVMLLFAGSSLGLLLRERGAGQAEAQNARRRRRSLTA